MKPSTGCGCAHTAACLPCRENRVDICLNVAQAQLREQGGRSAAERESELMNALGAAAARSPRPAAQRHAPSAARHGRQRR